MPLIGGPVLNLSPEAIRTLRRRALVLVWAGELWNLLEMAVALWAGVAASSVALVAFGLDSIVELFAGAVLIRHLSREWEKSENDGREAKALRLVGITFFLLTAFIIFQSTATLLGWLPQPRESPLGIALVIASAAIMFLLYLAKMPIAKKLESRALRAEAIESLVCDLQDLTVLVGLGLNALLGWWWADPIAALALIPFLVNEGREAFGETT
jgi:divalent metal cation (Fe/Co/Zn/Cd) transporter